MRENAKKEAEARKRATYEEAMKNYEISVREKPFDPPPVPVDNLLKIHTKRAFLLPSDLDGYHLGGVFREHVGRVQGDVGVF